jgi:catechol 2,3-dioxygenase-like lactoylglutathione lyase family enzyme
MNVKELRIALTVDDFDKAVTFYQDVLGLGLVKSWNNPDGRGLILAVKSATLELFDKAQADTVDSIEAGKRVSGQIRFALQVDDIEKISGELEKAGATIVNTPVQTPWGDTNQRLQTPDGLQLTLFQTKGKSE